MVFQTNAESGYRSFVYGTADPLETVTFIGNGNGTPFTTTADKDGNWYLELSAGAKYNTFRVFGSNNSITVSNIVSGDVFLCIGDQNMLLPMKDIYDSAQEIAKSSKYPSIRIATLETINSDKPSYSFPSSKFSGWQQANSTTLNSFSAMCYLSAQKLLDIYKNGTDIGLLQISVEMSTLNCFASSNAIDNAKQKCGSIPSVPSKICNDSTLYNGMIYPFIYNSYRSFIWDLGSNDINASNSKNYGCFLGEMINDWRDTSFAGDTPFTFVQLSSITGYENNDDGNVISNIRMGQDSNLPRFNGSVDISGMAVSYDFGNKTADSLSIYVDEIAYRMAAQIARIGPVIYTTFNSTYYRGPQLYGAYMINDGLAIMANFTFIPGGNLKLKLTMDCTECCQASNLFQISIDGDKWYNITKYVINENVSNEVLLSDWDKSVNGKDIKYLRYALTSFVECALTGSQNTSIPVAPFIISINSTLNSGIKYKKQTFNLQDNLRNFTDKKLKYKREYHRQQRLKNNGGCCQTPSMGFSSWNWAHCNFDERLVKKTANAMIDLGLAKVGYKFIKIDDCWEAGRNPYTGEIIIDSVRFPSGYQYLSQWLLARNLSLAIYTARGSRTCQGREGSYLYEYIDVNSYCEWGISYVWVDSCGGKDYKYPNQSWIKFRDAIDECYNVTGNDMLLSVEYCSSVNGCGQWIGNIANEWRTTGDIQDSWQSIMNNAENNQALYVLDGPGHFNLADMLEIGNPGLSVSEQRVHFSLWCIMASPLLIGTDLMNINNDSLEILLNEEAIAVNQDVLGIGGHRLGNQNVNGSEVWFKTLSGGNVAIVLLNRADPGVLMDVMVNFMDVGINMSSVEGVVVRDLWLHEDVGNYTGDNYTGKNINGHDCQMLKLLPY